MSVYLEPMFYAAALFPMAAFMFTLPYLIVQYKKYGAVPFLRSAIVYSFILYMMVLYFLVILPLPSFEEVRSMTGPYAQFMPFKFLTDFLKESGFDISAPSTWLRAFMDNSCYTVVFNLFLFIPFGVYMRYYFRCKPLKTLILSLSVSLSCELLQLTGLLFIYPRPYRLFDVDDLLINSLGGMLGYLMTPLFTFFLPKRENIDETAYKKGKTVPVLRKLLAFYIDRIVIYVILIPVSFISNVSNEVLLLIDALVSTVYFALITYLNGGQSLGKKLLSLKLVRMEDEGRPTLLMCFLRYLFVCGILYHLPEYSSLLGKLSENFTGGAHNLIFAAGWLCYIPYIVFFFEFIFRFFSKNRIFFYDRLFKTKNISIIGTDPAKAMDYSELPTDPIGPDEQDIRTQNK